MGLLTEQDLQSKINSQDYEWFTKGGNRSRFKRFIKTNQINEQLLRDLFQVREIRYDLISFQQLPEDIVIDIINLVPIKGKKYITKPIFF